MQDDNSTITTATSEPAAYAPYTAAPAVRRQSGFGVTFLALTMFLAGGGLVGYLAWQGELDRYLPAKPNTVSGTASIDSVPTAAPTPPQPSHPTTEQLATVIPFEARLAMLENRFSRLDFKADLASGNAARAEGLLIAAAARRQIERGEPLGFVSDQLKLRFTDAQPQAIETILTFSRNPVTLDQLVARLEALAPNLTDRSQQTSFVERTRRVMAGLFIVHSDSPTLLAPTARIERARLMLTSRRIVNAIDEVERLPGAHAANKWIMDARRFDEAQRALDLIETTAMLEPRRLKDGAGQYVNQLSPLSTAQPSPQIPLTEPQHPELVVPTTPKTGVETTPPSTAKPTPAATPSPTVPPNPILP